MDRQELLRELEGHISAKNLDTDEIRLYVLLLTNCMEPRIGKIHYSAIKNAMGSEFTRDKLEKACDGLSKRELIKVTSNVPVGTRDDDFVLTYVISQLNAN